MITTKNCFKFFLTSLPSPEIRNNFLNLNSKFSFNSLQIEEFEDIKAGYKIKVSLNYLKLNFVFLKFTFDVNPYFENTEIFKEYNWSGADPRCSSTPIQWKPGKQKVKKKI